MWRGADGRQEYLINILWPLTSFTADNGATRIFPKSHGEAGMAKTDLGLPKIAECEPGSAICFLGSTAHGAGRSEENTSELQSLMRISYAVFCLKKKHIQNNRHKP